MKLDIFLAVDYSYMAIRTDRRKWGAAGGRQPTFDAERYKERNTVERAVNKLKQFRAVATRYEI